MCGDPAGEMTGSDEGRDGLVCCCGWGSIDFLGVDWLLAGLRGVCFGESGELSLKRQKHVHVYMHISILQCCF